VTLRLWVVGRPNVWSGTILSSSLELLESLSQNGKPPDGGATNEDGGGGGGGGMRHRGRAEEGAGGSGQAEPAKPYTADQLDAVKK